MVYIPKSFKKNYLENWLKSLNIENNILLSIFDLNIDNVTDKLNINVIFMESYEEVVIWYERAFTIFLNPEKSKEAVRAIFSLDSIIHLALRRSSKQC